MILIADSGSTKTNWCLLSHGGFKYYFDTEGYNPYFVSTEYILDSLNHSLPAAVNQATVSSVYFYGAGCFEDKASVVANALSRFFFNAANFVGLDLLASARSVLGTQPGFVAILGTGTNSCIYDGDKITSNIDSLGYLLGDEGSGFYIGRKLLGDYIRGYMPLAVRTEFFNEYGLSREAIMERVYTEKLPNRFCASFTKFISVSKADEQYTHGLVKSSFIDFFENLVTRYADYTKYTFNCTGSIGYTYRNILAEVARLYNMEVGVILKEPIEGLAQHYTALHKLV